MTRWFIGLLACALATCQPSRADVTTYSGALYGTVSAVPVAAAVEIQLDGTPAVGATVKARARLTSDPLGYPISRDWSRWYTAAISGQPFRANVDLPDLRGRLGVDWTASNITVAAAGTASVFAVSVPPQRLAKAFSAPAPTNPPPDQVNGPRDAIAISAWQSLGPHKLDPRKMTISRELKSARNQGDTVRLSFDPLGWKSKSGGNGKSVDGAVVIVWQDGDGYTGGHFDWHGVGQTVKTQGNIPAGYLDHKEPPRGAPVWYFLCDLSYRERTNIMPGGTW